MIGASSPTGLRRVLSKPSSLLISLTVLLLPVVDSCKRLLKAAVSVSGHRRKLSLMLLGELLLSWEWSDRVVRSKVLGGVVVVWVGGVSVRVVGVVVGVVGVWVHCCSSEAVRKRKAQINRR